jgi:hypothetical protein
MVYCKIRVLKRTGQSQAETARFAFTNLYLQQPLYPVIIKT